MFSVDEATAEAIGHALTESGELPAIVELRRHFRPSPKTASALGVQL
jgi:hypothetical protein